jgi:hypothetical protein
MKRSLIFLATLLCSWPALAQQVEVERYVREHQATIVREFLDLVAIPNVRTDVPNIKRNAELLRQMLDRREMKPEVWDTPSMPLVYGERLVPGSTRTILFYIHYDGQPVDKTRWKQPDPFQPVLRAGSIEEGAEEIRDFAGHSTFPDNWRIYAPPRATTKGLFRHSCQLSTPSAASPPKASK